MTPKDYLLAIKPLDNPEEIKAVCEKLEQNLFGERNYAPKTRANKLTPYNRVINSIPIVDLIEGQNAYFYIKNDGTQSKRHLHYKFLGLSKEQWKKINSKTNYQDDSSVREVRVINKEPPLKLGQVRATVNDTEFIKTLQEKLNLPNQQAVISYLIEKSIRVQELERQLLEALHRIKDLEEKLTEQPVTTADDEILTAKVESIVKAKIEEILPSKLDKFFTKPKLKPLEQDKDWSSVNSEELKKFRKKGATDERIYRAFKAICNYNDHVAISNCDRWFIGNVTLRLLSGCNGLFVRDWMKRHQNDVDIHNKKYSLGQYHNKCHRKVKIGDLIKW